jgi:hypothetical protein
MFCKNAGNKYLVVLINFPCEMVQRGQRTYTTRVKNKVKVRLPELPTRKVYVSSWNDSHVTHYVVRTVSDRHTLRGSLRKTIVTVGTQMRAMILPHDQIKK